MNNLILSLFPGIGLLDMAFEELGFCIVRGPDVLWGGDIKRFHPPAGCFAGVIGGPPCQAFSKLVHMVKLNASRDPERYKVAENLIPEFERCIAEAQPRWFLMENVPDAPLPCVDGYAIHAQIYNNRWCGGIQNRTRRISFGTRGGRPLHIPGEVFQPVEYSTAVLASGNRAVCIRMGAEGKEKPSYRRLQKSGASHRSVTEALDLQGLPADFFDKSPLTVEGKQRVIGNGVPLPMGRAIAAAVKCLLESEAL
jgi:DNA (cytosine-5)-methyltransferase 1